MPSSPRPLAKATIDELTQLYLSSGGARFSGIIRDELTHRKLSKTEKLRQAVGAASGSAHRPTSGPNSRDTGPLAVVFPCQGCGQSLRIRQPRSGAPHGVATCPACGSDYWVGWGSAWHIRRVNPDTRQRRGSGHAGGGTPDSAEQQEGLSWALSVLELPARASRADMDMTRRRLLQQLHPDKHGASPPRVQKLMEAEFKRVERAYGIASKAIQR